MTMTINGSSLIGSDSIYTDQGIREQVMNYNDWSGTEVTPTSFAAFNAFGQIGTANNEKILINETSGIERTYTASANLTVASVGSTVELDFDSIITSGYNNRFRPGNTLRISGINTGANATSALMTAHIKIESKGSNGKWNCKTLNVEGNTASLTFDYDASARKTYMFLSDAEDMSGAAPESFALNPTQTYNWMQLRRIPWGIDNSMESTDKYFGNTRINTSSEAQGLLFGGIEHDILFSHKPLKQYSAESGGASGTGDGSAVMGGLPWFLKTSNLAAAGVKTKYQKFDLSSLTSVASIQSKTDAIDFLDALYDWADKFDATNETLLLITSTAMRKLIRRALQFSGDVIMPGKLQLPTLNIYYEEFDLGHIRMRMVVSDALNKGASPIIFDGSNFVYQNYFAYAINLKHVGIMYRNRKDLGIMAPSDMEIMPLRRELKYESEWICECTLGVEHQYKHGVFYGYI